MWLKNWYCFLIYVYNRWAQLRINGTLWKPFVGNLIRISQIDGVSNWWIISSFIPGFLSTFKFIFFGHFKYLSIQFDILVYWPTSIVVLKCIILVFGSMIEFFWQTRTVTSSCPVFIEPLFWSCGCSILPIFTRASIVWYLFEL